MAGSAAAAFFCGAQASSKTIFILELLDHFNSKAYFVGATASGLGIIDYLFDHTHSLTDHGSQFYSNFGNTKLNLRRSVNNFRIQINCYIKKLIYYLAHN